MLSDTFVEYSTHYITQMKIWETKSHHHVFR